AGALNERASVHGDRIELASAQRRQGAHHEAEIGAAYRETFESNERIDRLAEERRAGQLGGRAPALRLAHDRIQARAHPIEIRVVDGDALGSWLERPERCDRAAPDGHAPEDTVGPREIYVGRVEGDARVTVRARREHGRRAA